jgi:hypothetical protein
MFACRVPVHSFVFFIKDKIKNIVFIQVPQNVKHPVNYGCFLCKRWLQPDQVMNSNSKMSIVEYGTGTDIR